METEAPRRKIILVDDVNYVLTTLREGLKNIYDIYPAQSADILFELLTRIKPELIILDIQMPQNSGFDIIKRLKTEPSYKSIPVIFLTGNLMDRKSMIKGMSLGAVDFITKPVNKDALIQCIESHLNPPLRTVNKPIILAIDDSPSILQTLKHILDIDYSVYTLAQPERIQDILSKIVPDLFILDCQMPVLHGFDLVPIIRKESEHIDTPIVFLTSEGTLNNVAQATSIGASSVLVKPINDKILLEKVASLLENYMTVRRVRTARKAKK
jgi:DNA-binding response OmpR family regulator